MSQFHSVATEFQLAARLDDIVPADWDGELATAQLPAFQQRAFASPLCLRLAGVKCWAGSDWRLELIYKISFP
jgi:hypothetical protein